MSRARLEGEYGAEVLHSFALEPRRVFVVAASLERQTRESPAALAHQLSIEEWDTATLDSRLRDRIKAVYDPTMGDGHVIIVPAGQDPIVRLAAVRDLIADMRGAA